MKREAFKATPIPDTPALEIANNEKIICVGDLHIGFEAELRKKGIHVPSQTHRMHEDLTQFAKEFDRLILLGDIKHQVPGITRQEHLEIPNFFRSLRLVYKRIDLVKGNHDGGIETFMPDGISIHPATGITIGNVAFFHGHTWPSDEILSTDILVMSHNHPAVLFEDGLGNVQSEPCWVKASPTNKIDEFYDTFPKEIILMPAFNRMLGGSPINVCESGLLGPLFTNNLIDLDNAEVYLLDGVKLGRVRDITVSCRNRRSSSSR
ncbi:MAG: metallophosphoesterase [Methanomassiliicoccales archaeon]